jgi:HK97 family phage portal protein
VADTAGGVVVRDLRGRRRVELRDPSAATGNLGWRARGAPMVPEWDAENAVRWGLYANVAVYRCVQTIANALARVPLRAGADPDKPKDYRRDAPLARLLGPAPGGPNSETSARQLIAWTVAQYLVTGRFGWENELDQRTGDILALWPLPASNLRAIPSSGGAAYFDRFMFGPKGSPAEKKLTVEQVTYGWRPSAHDWREPESVLQAARLDVSVAVMQDRYDYAFLKNGARPDFLIVHQAIDDDDERAAFRDQWNSEHRGPDNAGRPAFAETEGGEAGGAIDVKQLGLSQRDAQSIQRYAQKIQAICVAFGTPLSKLGDSSARTFSNASQENANWWEDTVQPLGEELTDIWNTKLAPRLGSDACWFDWSVVPALRRPARFTATDGIALVQAGLADPSEVRSEVDLPTDRAEAQEDADPDEGTQLLPKAQAFAALVKAGLTPASAALLTGFDVTALEVAPPPPAVPVAPVVVPPAREAEHDQPRTLEPPAVDEAAAAAARRDRRWATVDSRASNFEKTWQRTITRMLGRQERKTLAFLAGKRGRQLLTAWTERRDTPEDVPNASDIYNVDFWTADTEETVTGLYEMVAAAAGQDVAERFGMAFDVAARYVQDFIHARANQLAGQVTDTTYRQIQQALADGVAQGLGIDDLATAVRHVFDVASTARAETIARTEVISAYNGAATLEAAQLPADVVAGKEWVSTRDDRVRDAHAEADGQVVTMADPFSVGGEDLSYPGDGSAENAINCRCTVTFLTPDEMPTPARSRQVDERTARAAFRVVHAGMLDPDELTTRLRVVA